MSSTFTVPTSTTSGLVAGTWVIDPAHSEVAFTVRHLMTKVRGTFKEFSGEIVTTENPLDGRATATIELSSVDTRNEQRDGHLRSGDFFDVESRPKMTFTSTAVRQNGDSWVVTGDLTIKDVTKAVELDVDLLGIDQNAYGQTVIGFEAHTSISRKDWGIDFNVPLEGGKLLIGDKVDISLDVQAALQA
ncbi:MAG TPA: YceI family protein [Kribbellaceae bacterium]|nr:YceI family protein [Kribbellaceae bacterium]